MNEIVPLDQLATEIRYYSQQATWSIIEVGKRLIEAKKQVAHGEWAEWLEKNVHFKKSSAANFMQCAERFSNFQSIGNLNPTQVIALLSLPESETETFIEQKKAEGTPVEDMTVKKLRDEIKDWKSQAEQAKQENATLTEQYNAQAKELQDLRDNPTVVETPADPEYIVRLENEAAKAKAEAKKANLDYETLQDRFEDLNKKAGDLMRERDEKARMAEEIAGELKQSQELNNRLMAERGQTDSETEIVAVLATAARQITDENMAACVQHILSLNDGQAILARFRAMLEV